MRSDPHEHEARTPEYAKDERVEALLEAANVALEHADLPRPSDVDPAALPLVYVVGAPRSGTTLLYQLLARHLAVGYITNLAARFWLRPSVGIALSRAVLGAAPGEQLPLRSAFGTTEGPAGPHEFGYFWRRWLRLDESPTHHLDEAAQGRVDVQGLRSALRWELLAPSGTAVVLKNVVCGFHARLLTRVHPRSLFLHVVRDTGAVARSILASRRERYGAYDAWWSLKPSTYPFDGDNPAAEVVRQAMDCRREIADELAAPGVTALTIDYGDVCAEPKRALRAVQEAVRGLGREVALVGRPPARLDVSQGPQLPEELEAELHRILAASC
jgi:LPS sulfotransferase NodH